MKAETIQVILSEGDGCQALFHSGGNSNGQLIVNLTQAMAESKQIVVLKQQLDAPVIKESSARLDEIAKLLASPGEPLTADESLAKELLDIAQGYKSVILAASQGLNKAKK